MNFHDETFICYHLDWFDPNYTQRLDFHECIRLVIDIKDWCDKTIGAGNWFLRYFGMSAFEYYDLSNTISFEFMPSSIHFREDHDLVAFKLKFGI